MENLLKIISGEGREVILIPKYVNFSDHSTFVASATRLAVGAQVAEDIYSFGNINNYEFGEEQVLYYVVFREKKSADKFRYFVNGSASNCHCALLPNGPMCRPGIKIKSK